MPTLDKVKDWLGIKKTKKQSTGHRLGGSTSPSSNNSTPGTSSSQVGGPNSTKSTTSRKASKKTPPLTDEERNARRDAMASAAANRGKAWDKKVSKVAQQRREEEKRKEEEEESNSSLSSSNHVSEETLRAVEQTKLAERQTSESMGYNPYKPVMSSTTSKGGSMTAAETAQLKKDTSSPAAEPFEDVNPEVKTQFAEAVECLLCQSLPGVTDETVSKVGKRFQDGDSQEAFEQGVVCINTVVKMLTNLETNPNEPKFRSIRLNNKFFRGKVAEVDGGLELIMSAGFILMEEAGGDGGEADTFLKHNGLNDTDSEMRQLQFVLNRLRHVQSLLQ